MGRSLGFSPITGDSRLPNRANLAIHSATFIGPDMPWWWFNCDPDIVMIPQDQSLKSVYQTQTETQVCGWEWEGELWSGVGISFTWWDPLHVWGVNCHQGTNAHPLVVTLGLLGQSWTSIWLRKGQQIRTEELFSHSPWFAARDKILIFMRIHPRMG